ncbi:MAG: tail fiber domain-containing protein [Lachnospiraceae bacterium]|jgi:hypothetical protein
MANYIDEKIDPSEKDMRKIAAYLYKLNEQLSYMFGNLTPDDNYSPKAYEVYLSDGKKITEVSASLDGIKLQMVRKGEVVAAINMSEEEIKIMAEKIALEGIVTANGNFKILEDGSMQSVNGKFSGTVTGSKIDGGTVTGSYIYGSTIEGSEIGDINGNFYTDGEIVYLGGFQAYDTRYGRYIATIDTEANGIGDNRKYAVWAGWDGTEAAFYATEAGDVECNEIYSAVAGESWSDERLKKDISEIPKELAAEIVKNLKPVSYRMKKNGREGVGFVAQDVYLLCKKMGIDLPLYGYTPNREYLTIPYSNYIPLLVGAYQKQNEELESIKKRLEKLEERGKENGI